MAGAHQGVRPYAERPGRAPSGPPPSPQGSTWRSVRLKEGGRQHPQRVLRTHPEGLQAARPCRAPRLRSRAGEVPHASPSGTRFWGPDPSPGAALTREG